MPVPGTRQHWGGTRLLVQDICQAGRQEKGRALPKPSPCTAAGAGPAARPVHLVWASKEISEITKRRREVLSMTSS